MWKAPAEVAFAVDRNGRGYQSMTIRTTLLLLTGVLALALIVAVGGQLVAQADARFEAQRLHAHDSLRGKLTLLASRLGEERGRAFVMLRSASASEGFVGRWRAARTEVDRAFEAALAEVRQRQGLLSRPEAIRATLAAATDVLQALREDVDDARGASDAPQARRLASRWFDTVTDVIASIGSLRLSLLQDAPLQDTALATESRLRRALGLMGEHMGRIRARLAAADGTRSAGESRALDEVVRDLGAATLALELTDERQIAGLRPGVADATNAVRKEFEGVFKPAALGLLNALRAGDRRPETGESWFEAATRSIAVVDNAQRTLLRSSEGRLRDLEAAGQRLMAMWAGLLMAGLLASAGVMLIVRRRVIEPIEELSAAMLRLAENDLDVELPKPRRRDEIGAMQTAFRTFKANAVQRQRLQRERDALNESLAQAYAQLKRDLEAAAAIQEALLPPNGRLGPLRHVGLFRPSSVVAGDSYNVILRPNGAVAFFQIDVAGHGAPAALVAVASQNALAQAALGRHGDASLAVLAKGINSDWPDELPYFTMVFGEVDPVNGEGRLVQAGHPAPLIVSRDGSRRTVGEGGLPVGMISEADYDEATFRLEEGERLILYSDGLTEAEDSEGRPFDEQLPALIRRHANSDVEQLLEAIDEEVRRWRGSDDLDDDLTVLVIERTTDREVA